jgi:hypothetical protein
MEDKEILMILEKFFPQNAIHLRSITNLAYPRTSTQIFFMLRVNLRIETVFSGRPIIPNKVDTPLLSSMMTLL